MNRVQRVGPEAGFYASLPVIESFAQLADPSVYSPVPEDWVLGLADIVRSTNAIHGGRYKTVNTAAAAVIAAVANSLPGSDFPFVFGGDGASFALPPEHAGHGRDAHPPRRHRAGPHGRSRARCGGRPCLKRRPRLELL
jgi:Protein of unknown function (DUF3095)